MATQRQVKKVREGNRHPKKRAKGQVVAEINVTPLVDVVLVLLIIFMVVTPMIVSGVAVDLPKTVHHQKKPDDGKDIIVSVTAEKEVYIMGRKTPVDQVSRRLDEELRKSPGKTIFVKGDNRVDYGTARKVMEQINKIGVEDVMLGTEEIPDPTRRAPAAQ